MTKDSNNKYENKTLWPGESVIHLNFAILSEMGVPRHVIATIESEEGGSWSKQGFLYY